MSSHAPGTPARTYPPRPEAVYFYGTCLVDTFVPEAGMDAISSSAKASG
jgi:L-lactate dehydrogenase complex protein LldE